MRLVPRVMENHRHWGIMARALMDNGVIAIKWLAGLLRAIGKDRLKDVAEHFNGGPLGSDGAKLLDAAYNIGNEMVARLEGGGM